MARKLAVVLVAALATLMTTAAAKGSHPKTLTVGQQSASCPNPGYERIGDAIEDAAPGDTIAICPGTYAEGPGTPGTSVLTIHKDLTLRGAGADQVTIEPRSVGEKRMAADNPDLRDGLGVIVAVIGGKNNPVTVNISGVTVDANGVDTTAGIVYIDAAGSISRSHVTGLVTDEGKNGYTVPGGFRNGPFGIGIADVTRVKPNAGNRPPIPPRTLTIDHTRVDHYNSVGILIDGATGDYSPSQTSPLTASGVPNRGVLIADVIAGRNSCHHYNDFTAGGQTDPDLGRLIVGDCQPSGSGATGVRPPLPLYVGPDFGQDGVRVTAGASIQITGTTISSNFVHGANAPIGSVLAPTPNNNPFALGNHAENNQNLRLGAGVRLVGAAASSVAQSNVTDNGFGVLNTTLNGLANNTATPVAAQNDYWGLRVGSSAAPIPLPTPGPAVWPNTSTPGSTFNPPIPENPVNGSPVADASCPAGIMDSDSVTFCPYRASTQSDTVGGEWPIPEAPIAPADPPNCTTGAVQLDPNIPTYNSFFGTVLGGPNAGDGLSGASPSAKKTAQLSAYLQAVADAVNANPGTTGQRVAVKLYQSGTSVLGVPFYVMVVGTPDNIANLDAGRNDAAFWRGVIDGTTSQTAALAAVDTRPAFGWITGTPHGNEPAGGEGSTKELYELVARTDCANSQRLGNLDVFIQPVTAPDDRDHNVRTLAWALDPNRDRGVVAMPENRALLTSTAT